MTLTVIKPAVSAALTTLVNFRLDTGGALGSASDRQVQRMIDQASSRIAMFCGRTFGRQIYRQRMLTTCGDFVFAAGPVNRVIRVGLTDGVPFSADQYSLSDGVLRLAGVGPAIGDGSAYNLYRTAPPLIEVDFEAGYLLPDEEVGNDFTGNTPLPAEIERAATQLVSVLLAEAGRDPTIRSETVQGVGSTTYAAQAAGSMLAHPGAESALQPYRLFNFA